ncbi:HlyD family secretion protein [Rhizobium mongolense]|uniref:HlyD family secretion protein n=1 Tax=Rhizobium mongolense TaxID=57676 RepID=UPI0034A0FD27
MVEKSSLRVVDDANAKNPTEDKNPIEDKEVSKTQETVAEAPSSNSAPAAAVAASDGIRVRRRRSLTRPVLFALLPVALVAGGYFYVNGGQVMSTDNAYIQADMVGLTTDVSGIVDQINVHENETVKAGQVLFSLKSDSFRIALDGAKAQLGVQRNQIENLKASYRQSLAEITQAKADIPYFQAQFDRQQSLVNSSAATRAAYDEAKHDLDAALQKVAVAKAQAATTLAELGDDASQPVEQNPLYLQAKSNVDNAQRELDHSVVKAPFDGVVTNVNALQVGSYLQASQQAFSLVATNRLWIAASPKETDLTYVKPGQEASIYVDTYPGVEWKGKVESISPASGSSFSLLPAQNTTGNWVKVVQRIPIHVSIDDAEGKPPLRVGMSTIVDVDTGHARGLPDFVNRLLGREAGKGHE